MKTNKLTVFKGASTEAKFENQMTLELGYSGKNHRYIDAKELMSNLVKCWNMHDEMIKFFLMLDEALNDGLEVEKDDPIHNAAKRIIKKAE